MSHAAAVGPMDTVNRYNGIHGSESTENIVVKFHFRQYFLLKTDEISSNCRRVELTIMSGSLSTVICRAAEYRACSYSTWQIYRVLPNPMHNLEIFQPLSTDMASA